VTFYTRLCAFTVPLRKLLQEEQIAVVQTIDPDDLLFRFYEKRAGATLKDSERSWILLAWNTLSNVFQGWADQLSSAERDRLARFFIKPLQSRHRMNRYRPSIIRRDGMRERVKAKTDVVHAHFHTLRFLARIRCQQARRLYDAVTAAQQEVLTAKRPLPHDFSYEEVVATGGVDALIVHEAIPVVALEEGGFPSQPLCPFCRAHADHYGRPHWRSATDRTVTALHHATRECRAEERHPVDPADGSERAQGARGLFHRF